MINFIFDVYSWLFSRKIFINLNKFFLFLGLRGLGFLNHKNFIESGERGFLAAVFLCKNPVVLDVGANIGAYSSMVRDIYPEAKILAFEPHPHNFATLKKAAADHHFSAFQIGLGKEEGNFPLFDYKNESGSSHASLYKQVITQIQKSETQEIDVAIRTLDNFINENHIDKIDLLKIDTEGNEYGVLLGAKSLLLENRIKVIQFEFSQLNMISRNYLADFYQLLDRFIFFRILRNGLMPLKEYNSFYYEHFYFQNIVAVKKDYLNELNSKLFQT